MTPAFAKFVLSLIAAMISFAPPGYSMYSQVPIPYCDTECQQQPLCADESLWKCKPPRLDPGLYQQETQVRVAQGMDFESAAAEAKPRSYTRPETYEEGLVRYRVIAEAVAHGSLRSSANVCKQQCQSLTDEAEVAACHRSCNFYAPWKWNYKELAYLTLTVWGMESGYRADVHGGVGPAGRGDCGYLKGNKQVSAATPGAKRYCKSVCLGQANVGLGYTVVGGQRWYADDLVGIDLASTQRCAMATMQTLARARTYCAGPMAPATRDWAGATLSMYGTGSKCDAPKLMVRSNVFYQMTRHPAVPTQGVLDLLADPRLSQAVSHLQTVSPVLWTIPLGTGPAGVAATIEPAPAAPVVDPKLATALEAVQP
jgi:hypothetical protein